MGATATQADGGVPSRDLGVRMGFQSGQVVMEVGWDEDTDDDVRDAVETATGTPMVDEDNDEAVDAVLLWFRSFDGDLADSLMDTLTGLASGGAVWLLTPKPGRDGAVAPPDIREAAPTAGLTSTTSFAASKDWHATRLVAPKGIGKKR